MSTDVYSRSETVSEVSWHLYEMSDVCRQMHCLPQRLQVCKDALQLTFDLWFKTMYCNVVGVFVFMFVCSLAGMTCVPECMNGTFFHLEEMTCIPCHSSCRTCTGMCGKEHKVNIWSIAFKVKVIEEYIFITSFQKHRVLLICPTSCMTWVSHVCSPGLGKEECIQCAEGYLQQEWRCVQTCAPGYYSGEAAGVPHKMCHRWV